MYVYTHTHTRITKPTVHVYIIRHRFKGMMIPVDTGAPAMCVCPAEWASHTFSGAKQSTAAQRVCAQHTIIMIIIVIIILTGRRIAFTHTHTSIIRAG